MIDSFKFNSDDNRHNSIIVIVSYNPQLAVIEQIINDSDSRSIPVSKNPSVILIQNDYSEPYQAVYHFYDQNGQLIE